MKVGINETEKFPREITLTLNGENDLQTLKDLIENINIDRVSDKGKRIYNLRHLLWCMAYLPKIEDDDLI